MIHKNITSAILKWVHVRRWGPCEDVLSCIANGTDMMVLVIPCDTVFLYSLTPIIGWWIELGGCLDTSLFKKFKSSDVERQNKTESTKIYQWKCVPFLALDEKVDDQNHEEGVRVILKDFFFIFSAFQWWLLTFGTHGTCYGWWHLWDKTVCALLIMVSLGQGRRNFPAGMINVDTVLILCWWCLSSLFRTLVEGTFTVLVVNTFN